MADEQPEEQDAAEAVPSPAAFLTMAQATDSAADTMFQAGDLESSNSYRTLARYLRSAARAAATIPPEALLVLAVVLGIAEDLNEAKVRQARRGGEGHQAGKAMVSYARLVQLLEATDAAVPGLIQSHTGKDFLG